MKSKILRVVAGATLLMAMAVGFQKNKEQGESSLMMENLAAIAMAEIESGGGGGGACPTTPNTVCYGFAGGTKGCFPVSEPDTRANCN